MGGKQPEQEINQYQLNKLLGIEYRQSQATGSFSEWKQINGHTRKRGRPKKSDNC